MPIPTHCPFCDVKKIASPIEEIDFPDKPRVMTFVPLDPVTEGHRLFVPTEHEPSASQRPDLAGALLETAAWWWDSHNSGKHMAANYILSEGSAATQTVFHMHLHLVPRHLDDGLHLPWTGQKKTQSDWYTLTPSQRRTLHDMEQFRLDKELEPGARLKVTDGLPVLYQSLLALKRMQVVGYDSHTWETWVKPRYLDLAEECYQRMANR